MPQKRNARGKSIGKTVPGKKHHEIEVKLRIADREALLRRLARLHASPARPRVHEMNTLYDTREGRLAQAGQMARVRLERPEPGDGSAPGAATATLTYKGPPAEKSAAYKIREEHEVRVASAEMLDAICRGLGLQPWFRYEKYRTPFRLPGVPDLVIDLDETPIGDFVELEGTRRGIDRAARLLGFRKRDYIVQSYGGLFMDSLERKRRARTKMGSSAPQQSEPRPGLGVPDMVFGTKMPTRERPHGRSSVRIRKK